MKILARQLAIDMYNCKPEKLVSAELLAVDLNDALVQAIARHFLKKQTKVKRVR